MPYVKLDCGILDSTIWLHDAQTRVCWITLLAMADASGMVEATAPGIAHRACLDLESTRKALQIFESPDPDSKTGDGRRIERVDGGYLVINYDKYRHKDHTAAERKRRQRSLYKNQQLTDVSRVTSVTIGKCHAKAYTEAYKEKALSEPAVQTEPTAEVGFILRPEEDHREEKNLERDAVAEVFAYYMHRFQKNSKVYTLTDSRRQKGAARYRECLRKTAGNHLQAIELMKCAVDALFESDWHNGREPKSQGKKYLDWNDHLFPNAEKLEKWLANA